MFQFLFKWNNNWYITEDLYEFLSAHLAALFGQEIALHKSCRKRMKHAFYVLCVFIQATWFLIQFDYVNMPELLQSVYIS